jgi:AcrR family transcriptional regulator
MAYETAIELAKLVLLPAIGFLAGFAAQWFLQERRSRDELVRALAEQRAATLCKLWEITTLPVEVTALGASEPTPSDVREQLDRSVLDWYTRQAGALFLSWPSTQLLFRLLDLLRTEPAHKAALELAVSSLRSQLKLDCGVYSRSEARRPLIRPRPSPWKVNSSGNVLHP